MKLNLSAINNLVRKRCGGNMAQFCRELNIGYTTMWRILNNKTSGTAKFIPALFAYCAKNDLNFEDYIS